MLPSLTQAELTRNAESILVFDASVPSWSANSPAMLVRARPMLVGVEGFEPSASRSQSESSTRLSYTPIYIAGYNPAARCATLG